MLIGCPRIIAHFQHTIEDFLRHCVEAILGDLIRLRDRAYPRVHIE
jgi:hypothetical protein